MEGRPSSVSERLNAFRPSSGGVGVGRGGFRTRTDIPNTGSRNDNGSTKSDLMSEVNANSNVNSGSGGNSDQHLMRRNAEKPRLYVKNINKSLTKDDLANIFSKYGKVISSFIQPPHPDYSSNAGLVEFEKVHEARTAIQELHKRDPHNLIVTYANDNPNKPHKNEVGEERRSTNHSLRLPLHENSSLNNSQREKVNSDNDDAHKDSRHQTNDKKKISPQDSRLSDSNGLRSYGVDKFNASEDPREVEVNNKLFGREPSDISGLKKTTPDRTVGAPRLNPPRQRRKHKSSPKIAENGAASDCNGKYSVGRSLQCPYRYGSCIKCAASAVYVCSWCKQFYCSQNCYQIDFSLHKTCPKRNIEFSSDGWVTVIEPPADMSDEHKISERPVGNQRDGNDNRFKPNSNRLQLQFMNKNASESVYVPKLKSSSPQPPEKVPEEAEKTLKSLPESSNNEVKAEKILKPLLPESSEKESKAEKILKPLLPESSEKAEGKTVKTEEITLPLPKDQFSDVMIVHKDDEAYYVWESSRQDECASMSESLGECASKEAPLKNPKLGDLCATLFDGSWSRCRITDLKGSDAKVRFVDFGNDETVQVSSLKNLRADLSSIPDFAIPIKINDQSNVPLEVGSSLRVKPIRMLKNMQLIAQIENDPAPVPEPHADQGNNSTEVAPPKKVCKESSKDHLEYKKYIIVFKEAPITFWVTESLDDANRVSEEIHSRCNRSVPVGALKENGIYGCLFEKNLWCRCQVLSLKPRLSVFYVDYGNAEEIQETLQFVELTPDLKTLKPLAFKIELEEGFPEEYLKKSEQDEIEFAVILQLDEETSLVRVIDSVKKDSIPFKNEPVKLVETVPILTTEDKNLLPIKRKKNRTLYASKKCSSVTIEIHHVFGNDCVSGSLLSEAPDYVSNSDISAKLAKFKFVKTDAEPGDDVIARVGSCLYRGYVMKKESELFKVALVDYGRIVSVNEVAPLPQEMKNVFENSVRVIFDRPMTGVNRANLIAKRMNVAVVVSGTDYLKGESEQYGTVVIQPWEGTVEEMGLNPFDLTSGSNVIITSASSPKSVYLQSLDHLEKFNVLIQDVATFCLNEKSMTRKPLCNELIACRFEEDQQYYRALVISRNEDKYRVVFVDYGNIEDNVSQDSFVQLRDDFKFIPCFAVKVGLKDVPGPKFNPNALKLTDELSKNETTFSVSFEGKALGSVKLVNAKTGESLNQKLEEAMKPSWIKNPEPSLQVRPYMLSDLTFEPWPKNQPVTVGIVSVESFCDVTCLLAELTPAYQLVIGESFTERMTNYANTVDPYEPREQEMCLALFEGFWYRAVCFSIKSKGFEVFFIDYGNRSSVTLKELRKMPPEFMEPPACVKHCGLMNVFDDGIVSRESKEQLESELQQKPLDNCYVIDEESDRAVLWTNSLDSLLKKLGFPLVEQPPI